MLAVTAVILLAEMLSVGWEKSSLRDTLRFRDPSVRRDVIYAVLTYAGITAGATAWVLWAFWRMPPLVGIAKLGNDLVWMSGWHLIALVPDNTARFLLNLMVLDATGVLIHWAQHHIRWLWWIHEYHHSATSVTVWTSYRMHPLEPALVAGLQAIPMAILGVDIGEVFAVSVVLELYSLSLHSRANWNMGWIGRYVLFTPRHHMAHHKLHGLGGNYGTLLIWWDCLLGTYEEPAKEIIEVGVVGTPYNRVWLLAEPFVFLWNAGNWVVGTVKWIVDRIGGRLKPAHQ